MSHPNRREFIGQCAGIACACAIPIPLTAPTPLKLYTVSDSAACMTWEESTSMAFWAPDEATALRMFMRNYEYAEECDQSAISVVDIHDDPSKNVFEPREEYDYRVLREAGWMVESDRQCESCGLYTMDVVEHCDVCECCEECCQCGE